MTHLFCRLHDKIKISFRYPSTLRLIYGTEHSLKRQWLNSFDTDCNKLLKIGFKAKSNRNKIIVDALKIREKEFMNILKSNEVLMESLYALTSTYAFLHECAANDDHVGLKYLLDLGYCINGLDQNGRTPLGCCIGSIQDFMLMSSTQAGFRIDHYENMSMLYTAIFYGCKKDNFQMKYCDIFPIFAQNIDCGYTLEPPR